MREVELKAVIEDWDACRRRLERTGATLTFEGRLEDRRYDTAQRTLVARDQVLRIRVYRSSDSERAEIGWKGPTSYESGYKVREELGAVALDPDAFAQILQRLDYVVTRAIDRRIVQYELGGATVRLERYPRMDDLLEVEGTPEAIERAIVAVGIPRTAFTSDPLPLFVQRYTARTGQAAAICEAELRGPPLFRIEDA